MFSRARARPASPRSRLEAILHQVERVRPMPSSVARVLKALEDPTVTGSTLADLISLDQALTAQMLRMSNSVALGYGAHSSSVSDAVMRLGFNRVKTLVLGVSTSDLLQRTLSGYGIVGEELWAHAVASAGLARYLAAAVRYSNAEEAYVAGLLHDLGKSVLDQYVRVDYQVLAREMRAHQLQLWQVEEKLFGMDHGAVGGLMAEQWQFPPGLAQAIRCHHWPSLAKVQPELAALVNIANAWAPRPAGRLTESKLVGVHPEAPRILGLDEAALARLLQNAPVGGKDAGGSGRPGIAGRR